MSAKLARIISIVFHPVFLLFYVTVILVFTPTFSTLFETTFQKYIFCGFILLFVTVIPCLLMLVLKRFRIINSFDMVTTRERWLPYIYNCLAYIIIHLFLYKNSPYSQLEVFFLGMLILQFIILIINFLWKISIHATGFGAITGLFFYLALSGLNFSWFYSVFFLLLSVFVVYARLRLKAHSKMQVAIGWLLGFSVMLFMPEFSSLLFFLY